MSEVQYFDFNHKFDGLNIVVTVGVVDVSPRNVSAHNAESDLDYIGYSSIEEVYVANHEVEDLSQIGLTEDMIWAYYNAYVDTNKESGYE